MPTCCADAPGEVCGAVPRPQRAHQEDQGLPSSLPPRSNPRVLARRTHQKTFECMHLPCCGRSALPGFLVALPLFPSCYVTLGLVSQTEHGSLVLGTCTVEQAYGGMRRSLLRKHTFSRACVRASLLRSRCGVRLIFMLSSRAIRPSCKCWSRCAYHAHVACSASRAWSTRRPSSMQRKASASAITQSPSARFPFISRSHTRPPLAISGITSARTPSWERALAPRLRRRALRCARYGCGCAETVAGGGG